MCTVCRSLDSVMRDAAQGRAPADPTGSGGFGLIGGTASGVLSFEGSDARADMATGHTLEIGNILEGRIGTGTDRDWIEVSLTGGESYVFVVWGTGGQSAGVNDTTLRLRDATGREIAFNDDLNPGSGNHFSAVRYEASETGIHYLDVGSYGTETGTYRLLASPETASVQTVATYMSEVAWGAPSQVRFDPGADGVLTYDVSGLAPEGRTLARWALEAWESVSALRFVEVSASAEITFSDDRRGAFAGPDLYYLDSGINTASSVNVGSEWVSAYGTRYDSYSFQTYLHEVGHALGLGHLGPYSGTARFGSDNLFANDSTLLSVMSYFAPDANPNVRGDDVIALTPMPADILAAAALYGDAVAHAGDTVWGANSTVEGMLGEAFAILYDGAPADRTIWGNAAVTYAILDTGGTDLLDLSTVSADQRIDLRPGAASDAGGVAGGLVIALDTVIENVATGGGHDEIVGNAADNRLSPGAGNDRVEGGGGTDTAVFGVARASATIASEGTGIRIVSAEGDDLFFGVERFEFTDATVTARELRAPEAPSPRALSEAASANPVDTPGRLVVGTGGNDALSGTSGDDTLAGQSGHDRLNGDDGHDILSGSGGDDTLAGDDGNDSIGGGHGNDRIDGGGGRDTVGGGRGEDTILGGIGHDVVNGGAGDDEIGGGVGNDTSGAGTGADIVNGGAGNDSLGGGAGRDRLSGGGGDDIIGAGEGDDTAFGDSGNDFIAGGGRNDVIHGGSGADTINGGAGDDTLTGGSGADTFVFAALNAGETDRITDFQVGTDVIQVGGVENAPGSGLAGYLAALGPTAVAGGTILSHDGHTILLAGVAPASLGLDDFVFV